MGGNSSKLKEKNKFLKIQNDQLKKHVEKTSVIIDDVIVDLKEQGVPVEELNNYDNLIKAYKKSKTAFQIPNYDIRLNNNNLLRTQKIIQDNFAYFLIFKELYEKLSPYMCDYVLKEQLKRKVIDNLSQMKLPNKTPINEKEFLIGMPPEIRKIYDEKNFTPIEFTGNLDCKFLKSMIPFLTLVFDEFKNNFNINTTHDYQKQIFDVLSSYFINIGLMLVNNVCSKNTDGYIIKREDVLNFLINYIDSMCSNTNKTIDDTEISQNNDIEISKDDEEISQNDYTEISKDDEELVESFKQLNKDSCKIMIMFIIICLILMLQCKK